MRFAAVAAALIGAVAAIPGELVERQATSTTTATAVTTIYSCPPSVTNCPTASGAAIPSGFTASVVYNTVIHTITACASSVTNCPVRVSTQTIELYTTICPITALQTVAPVPAPTTTSVYVAPVQLSYITYTTCVPTTYVSTITVTPTPTPSPIISAAPTVYPNGTYSAGYTGPTFSANTGASVKDSIGVAAALAIAAVLFA